MMRRLGVVGVCAVIVVAGSLAHGNADAPFNPATLEQSIGEQLDRRIDGLVPKERYKIIVNVKATEERVKVLLEGETQSQSDGKEDKPIEAALPGFQLLEKKTETQKVQKNERAKFTFKTRTELKQVAVKLIVDQSLDGQRKKLLGDIVNTAVSSSYGAAGTVETVELDLTNAGVPTSQRIGQWFSSYLGDRGGSAIDLAYLLGLLLIFLVVSLTAGRRFFKLRKGMADKPMGVADPKLPAGAKSGKVAEQVISQIVDVYVQSPLEVRRFLVMLPEIDRRHFLAAISAPALRNYFEGVLSTTVGNEADLEKVNHEKFETLVRDLQRYLQIQKEQVKHPFGYLETFELDDLRSFIQSESDPVATVAQLSALLSRDQYVAVTEKWSIAEKARLFKSIHERAATQDELDLLDQRLRQRYQILREKGIVQIKNQLQVEKDFLESETDIDEVLSHLAGEKYELSPELQKYRVTFQDLTTMDQSIVKNVLQSVPNEVLAKALVRQQQHMDTWSRLVGEIRFKLIDSIRARYRSLDPQEVTQAQREILRAYRALI